MDDYAQFSNYYSEKYTLNGTSYETSALYYGDSDEAYTGIMSTVEYYDNGTL